MSNSDSSTQWIIVVVLVGLVGVVACAGLGAAVFWVMPVAGPPAATPLPPVVVGGPMTPGQVEQERQAFARTWRAPRATLTNSAEAEAAGLFPAEFDGWQLASHDDSVKVPELALDRAGVHAVYESGPRRIDVYVCPVAAEEEHAVVQGAAEAVQAGGYSSPDIRGITNGFLHYMNLSFGPPAKHAWLWWSQGWLFVFVTEDNSIDLESFQRTYLTRIQAPRPSPIEEL